MATAVTPARGYYSVVRWLNDPARDEAKNLAIVLVTEDGRDGDMRSASVRSILAGDTRVQFVESLLADLKSRFDGEIKPTLEDLAKMHEGLTQSFQVTEPRRCAIVGSASESLKPLYRSLVQLRAGGGGTLSSAGLSRNVSALLNGYHIPAKHNAEIDGYHFDVVATIGPTRSAGLSTLSFATLAKDWTATERAAGHFLYALERTDLPGAAIINPPTDLSSSTAWRCHEKVQSWYSMERIPALHPDELKEKARVDWLFATAGERRSG